MFKTYDDAFQWITTRRGFGPKPGLKRMEWMMERLNHPERSFKSIHIGGTNGKGSTVAYLTQLFLSSGQAVGSFTSPHIMRFNERISLNGQPIPDDDVIALANRIKPLYDEIFETELGGLTHFEVVSSMMFLYFSEQQPDVVLVEVGLGGLFDSTNIITPELVIITTIGLDHINILGGTFAKIAFQKAGIIKPHIPIVLGNIMNQDAKKVLVETANEREAELAVFGEKFQAVTHRNEEDLFEHFSYKSADVYYSNLMITLLGQHQIENAATALHAYRMYCQAHGIDYTEDTIREGLEAAFWPVRMEILSKKPLIILDGAHNEAAMEALLKTLEDNFAGRPIKVMYATLTTKELETISRLLQNIPNSSFYLTTFDFPQAATLDDLKERMQIAAASYHEDWQVALNKLSSKANEDDVILVTGSLYFLSDVRKYLI